MRYLLSPQPTILAAQVVVNAGLWLDDPDVDAITRLCNDICATRSALPRVLRAANAIASSFMRARQSIEPAVSLMAATACGHLRRYNRTESFATEKGTWSPFNSQNTALSCVLCLPARPLAPVEYTSGYPWVPSPWSPNSWAALFCHRTPQPDLSAFSDALRCVKRQRTHACAVRRSSRRTRLARR